MPRIKFLEAWLSISLLLFSVTIQAQIPSGYYNAAQNKTGIALKAALNDIISGHKQYPYTSSSTDTWDILKEADRDPNNAANVIGIYSGFSMDGAAEYASGSGWSREHVWAKSRGDFGTSPGPGTDCHHLRAEDLSTNSARSNRNFDECTTPYVDQAGTYNGATESFTSATAFVWKPRAEVKGDVARMLFYMATRYEGENGEPDLELTETLQANDSKEPLHAKLSVLLAWHNEDPVSDAERNRNEIIYGYQNNRNPFIDHPEYVANIWEEVNNPIINLTTTALDFGTVNFGAFSNTLSYSVAASNLQNDLSISTNNGFEISFTENEADFTTNLVVPQVGGEISSTLIYTRFKPSSDSNSAITGSIIHSSAGATDKVITTSAAEASNATPEINFNYSVRSIDPVNTYAVELFADNAPNTDIIITVVNTSSNGFTYDQNYTTSPALIDGVLALEWKAGEINKSFDINFDYAKNASSNLMGSLNFSISQGNTYNVGTNSEFELKVSEPEIINGILGRNNISFHLYPNPATNQLIIEWNRKRFNYSILNAAGKIVIEGKSSHNQAINIADLEAGYYLIKVVSKKEALSKPLIIE